VGIDSLGHRKRVLRSLTELLELAERQHAQAQLMPLEEFELLHACPVESHSKQIGEDLQLWRTGTELGNPVTREYLDEIFEATPCLFRFLIYGGQLWIRFNGLSCLDHPGWEEQEGSYFAGWLSQLLRSGVRVPDVEFLVLGRDRPISALHEPAPIFAVSKTRSHADILFPDPDALHDRQDTPGGCLQEESTFSRTAFEDRKPILLWRGSFAGGTREKPMRLGDYKILPRARLVQLSERYPELIDAGFQDGNHEYGVPPKVYENQAFNDWHTSHKKSKLSYLEQTEFRFLAVVDGVSGTNRFPCMLLSGSTVFKQTSPYYQWYDNMLVPWKHFVPVSYDLHDLPALVE
ncbi:unnamed protein product, partial [Polarella glacialis]